MKYTMVVFFSVVCMLADQIVKTQDNIEIILKDDSTWVMVESTAELKSSTVATQDSQTVLLRKDGTWEYMSREGVPRDTALNVMLASDTLEGRLLEKTQPEDSITEVFSYYAVDVKPVPIRMPKPRYPEKARKQGIQGLTAVNMLVDVTGRVIEVVILKSSGNEWLDQAACEAAMKSIFAPAEIDGRKVRVWVSIPLKFQITP